MRAGPVDNMRKHLFRQAYRTYQDGQPNEPCPGNAGKLASIRGCMAGGLPSSGLRFPTGTPQGVLQAAERIAQLPGGLISPTFRFQLLVAYCTAGGLLQPALGVLSGAFHTVFVHGCLPKTHVPK